MKLKKKQLVEKAIVIGSGSIGQRHIKNLKKIGFKNIFAFRTKKGHYQNLPSHLGVKELFKWKDVVKESPDIAIVSNPTSLHLKTATKLSAFVKGIFMEKPLSNSLRGVDKLVNKINKNNTVFFVGHNLMFHPIILNIKKFVNSKNLGKLINIQCQAGHWLPDWHPYENYKNTYFANKKLGGGVALTLIHEIHLAIEFAGNPSEVCGMQSNYPLLDIDRDIDIVSDIMVRHESGCVSQIHIDFIQKPYHRSGLITFERGWISYDFNQSKVVAQTFENKHPTVVWSDKKYNNNDMYIMELKNFIDCVREGRIRHPNDIEKAIVSLKLVELYFGSVKNKKIIKNKKKNKFKFV